VAVTEQVETDEQKLGTFMDQAVGELGATLGAALVVIGNRLGLYKVMAGAGALTSTQLAARTATAERYVREWLNAQAAGGYEVGLGLGAQACDARLCDVVTAGGFTRFRRATETPFNIVLEARP
jgi:hypothetical protein